MIEIMENEINNNIICQYPSTLDELVQEMEKHPEMYKHLRIFQRCGSINEIPVFGDEYLAVSHDGFGLYRIDSIDYQNGTIILTLTETSTNKSLNYMLDIYNEQPSCLFIRWKDIWNIVLDECLKSDVPDMDLLELIE